MGTSLILESVTTALSAGMGCGTCCGTGISAALYGYLTTHARDVKQSFRAFLDFFLGKMLAVVILCVCASLLGRSILGEDGRIFGISVSIAVDFLMIAMGIRLLISWIRERYKAKTCRTCNHCHAGNKEVLNEKRLSRPLLLGMGFGYGISPCAPLILMTGYAATLPAAGAAVLGSVFAAASTLSPALLILLLSGVLAGKMRKDIPSYLTWFRLMCYILLIVLFTVRLIQEITGGN